MKIKRCKTATCSREYTIALKSYKVYCKICNRRAGIFDAYCGPCSNKKNKNWKDYRFTQYKE